MVLRLCGFVFWPKEESLVGQFLIALVYYVGGSLPPECRSGQRAVIPPGWGKLRMINEDLRKMKEGKFF